VKAMLCAAAVLAMSGDVARLSNTESPTRHSSSGSDTTRAQVMILGVAHLVARRDVHNSVFQDSPLSPARQAQIADVVARLARFHPTKVLVEAPMGDSVVRNHYRDFVSGHFQLPADEVHQFGFKLAAQARDSTIYPIDTFGPPGLVNDSTESGKRIVSFLEQQFSSVTTPAFQAFLARSDTLERRGTYLELLQYLNTDAAIRANASVYSVLVGMGRDADNAGSAYVSDWYARNCYIFSNILAAARPGDRVIVIMGQGHEYLLREFARLNPSVVYIDPLHYLDQEGGGE
jgi:Family of unknown function (DUF5694)